MEETPISPKNSPEKAKNKPVRVKIGTRLQLYNSAHKIDLLKLLTDVKKLSLRQELTSNDNEKGLDFNDSEDEDDLCLKDEEESLPLDLTAQNVNENETSSNLHCTTCGANFAELVDLRIHNRLDWHRYNVQRKLHSQNPISEAQFDDMLDDLSSIEGSDSENQESTNTTTIAVNRLMDKVAQVAKYEEDLLLNRNSREMKLVNSPKVYFENSLGQVFGIFKSVAELGVDHRILTDEPDIKDMTFNFKKIIETPLNIALLMVSGGHFAAAIFKGGEVICHKTFHSYTVRAKQGGSQGSQDSKSGTSQAKSAGASLRRYNEQSFMQHVQDLLVSWSTKLAKCEMIFYRAVGSNSNVLFGGKNPPLQRGNGKLRTVPFPTKRPTFAEVKRVLSLLTVIHFYEDSAEFLTEHMTYQKKPNNSAKAKSKKNTDRAKSRSPKRHVEPIPESKIPDETNTTSEDEELVAIDEEVDLNYLKEYDDSLTPAEREAGKKKRRSKLKKPKPEEFPRPLGIFGDLFDALSTSNSDSNQIETQIKCLQESFKYPNEQNISFLQDVNQLIDLKNSTFLHLAAKKNVLEIIWTLLECGCDPSARDSEGKLPYNYAETKESRAVFRKFMGQYPDKYDYKKSQIPAPITEEIEAEKAEKKRLLNKLKRVKEKQKKQEKMEKEKEINEKERFLNLSDREKRAMAAEQRILAQCKRNGEQQPVLVRCFECACDMTGKVPFEYNQNIFCNPKCLAVHRKKFPVPLSV